MSNRSICAKQGSADQPLNDRQVFPFNKGDRAKVFVNGKEVGRAGTFENAKDLARSQVIRAGAIVKVERSYETADNGAPITWTLQPGGQFVATSRRGPRAMEELFRF